MILNEDRGIQRTEVNISMKIPEEGEYTLQIGVPWWKWGIGGL